MNSMTSIASKFQHIKLLVLDIDNILTDGKIIYSESKAEIKNFSVLDGLGIKLAQKCGIKIGAISARKSDVSMHRLNELKFDFASVGHKNKIDELVKYQTKMDISMHETAYMGDDILDLKIIEKCGLSFTVPQALFSVKREVDYVTVLDSGNGAVREVIDLIINKQKKKNIIKDFLKELK
ncbi:MAG: hypothetical protein COA79_00315 [Planctomycetota bacterium]|nr:MAG: hypothetical protein COA79_00315 [Planctomycetota bacterium]